MDFRSLLQSMTTLSEAEGKVHKGTYGTSHGKEDVRDQYGHKVGKVDKEAGSKKDAPKKGRGRPKKGADDSGEVKTYDTKTLGDVFGGGKKPKKEVGKVSKKHSLKEYIEEAEQALNEAEQVTIAPAQQNTQVIKQGNKTLGTVTNPQLAQQIKQSIGKGEMTLAGDEQIDEIGNTPQGQQRLAKVQARAGQRAWDQRSATDTNYAMKQRGAFMGAQSRLQQQGQVAEGEDEGKPGKNFAKIAKSAGEKYGSKAAGERVAGAVRAKLAKQGKLEESISLTESPATLQHIISRFKNEVKRFVNGDELDNDLYDALYDYYADIGEMPYGTAKGRTGDPFEWVTQRFNQDVRDHVVDENAMRDFTQHALAEPTSSFTKPGSPMAVPKGTPTKINRPVPDPTPWGTDPIAAATDRAFNFVSSLGKGTKFTKEGTDMKDIQLESWEQQLNGLLTEGITVSSSQGQQGAPDSVSVTATDGDAESLLSVLRNAGIGGFGAEKGAPEIGYGVAQGGEEEPTGTGTEPQAAPEVVGDGDDMLALIKKLTGMGDEAEVVAVGGDEEGQDYEDEEGEEPQTLEPADSGEDDGKEELTGSEEEKTDEGNKFTGNLAKARAAGKSEADLDGDGDMEKVKEDDVEEGNKFTGNLAKARAAGKSEADLDGDGDMEKVREGEDTCMECGGSMYEGHSCGSEQVEENFANDAGGDAMADTELAKLKALLAMGGDLHKMKRDQTVGNPTQVSMAESLAQWKKLSGIK